MKIYEESVPIKFKIFAKILSGAWQSTLFEVVHTQQTQVKILSVARQALVHVIQGF